MGLTQISGQVKVGVDVSGTGDAPKKLKDSTDGLGKLKGTADQVASSLKGVTETASGLKKVAEPVNKVREGFENLKANAVFGVGAVIGVVTGLGEALSDLVLSLSDNAKAVDAWNVVQTKMGDGLKRTQSLLADVRKLLGEPIPDEFDQAYSRLHQRLAEVASDIDIGRKAITAMNDQLDTATTLVPGLALVTSGFNQQIVDEQSKINKLKAEQYSLDKASIDLIAEQTRATREFAQVLDYIAGKSKSLPASRKPFMPQPEAPIGNPFLGFGDQSGLSSKPLVDAIERARTPRRGGGRGDPTWRRTPELGDDWIGEQAKKVVEGIYGFAPPANDNAPPPLRGATGKGTGLGDVGPGDVGGMGSRTKALDETATVALKVASNLDIATGAMSRFTSSFAPLLEEMVPGLGEAFDGLDAAMQSFVATTGKSTQAQVQGALSGATAFLGGVGKMLGGLRGYYIAKAAGEEAESIASFAFGDLVGGFAHQAAAIAFGVAAGKAGGGGAARAGSGGGSSSGSRSPTRSLYDRGDGGGLTFQIFGGWFGGSNPQESAAALHGMIRRGAPSGYVPIPWAA